MAKRKSPDNQIKQLPEYGELVSIMQNETASILTDYISQYTGIISQQGKGSAIYQNKDRVQLYQSYLGLACYDLYQEIENDPHVFSVYDSAKLNVAGMKWDVQAYLNKGEKKASTRNEDIAYFVKDILFNIGYLPQHLYNLLGALGMGYAVTEIVWKIEDGEVRIKELLNRPQRRFQFDAVDRSLRLRDLQDPFIGKPLPDKKFIVHRCIETWSNPFGDALNQKIYWMWLFKKTVLKFWMQHLQVGASSIPVVRHPPGANATIKAEALEIAKMIRNGAYGRVPNNFEIIYAEAKNAIQNAETYERFERMCNDEISKCINGQTLTTEASSAQGKGSNALGEVHEGTQSKRDVFRAEALASTLNATLVKWVTDFNFGDIDGYPILRPDLEKPADLEVESRIVKTISDAGYDFDERELSEKFNWTLTKKKPLDLKQNPFDKEKKPGENPEDNLEKDKEDEKE